VAIGLAGVPGLAALLALGSTNQQVNHQLQIAEQGQITDRYNAAITNLGSRSIEVRLGGIYALQRLMQDSPRDQSTVVAVLCAFIRDQTAPTVKPKKSPPSNVPTDVQAALTVVGTRNTANDGSTTVVDLDHAQLIHTQLRWLDLVGADLAGTNLSGADLQLTNLSGADLDGANLSHVYASQAKLTNASLIETNLSGADIAGAKVTNAYFAFANLIGINFTWVNLSSAILDGAKWSKKVPPPRGWVRDPSSGRLKRP
jgi:uncharacterized protein YjbI with pentapeptide repeats